MDSRFLRSSHPCGGASRGHKRFPRVAFVVTMRILVPLILLATFALAGCSDDEPEHDADHLSSSTTTSPPPMAPPTAPVTHEAILRMNRFEPADHTLHVGDTIHWVTEDVQAHNVVSGSSADAFRSEDISVVPVPPGTAKEYSHTFSVAGTIDYLCEYHTGMVGTVTVLNQTA